MNECAAEHLKREIEKTLADFNLDAHKIVAVVTDNAANVTATVRLMGLPWISCSAHTLQLCVREAFKSDEVSALMSKLSRIVSGFNASTLRTDILRDLQRISGSDRILALKKDVCIRWDSQFMMLERLLRLKDSVVESIEVINSNMICSNRMMSVITDFDWEVIADLVALFEPVFNCMKHLQNITLIGIPQFYPIIFAMKQLISGDTEPLTHITEAVKTVLIDAINRRFVVEQELDCFTSLMLDPLRFGDYLSEDIKQKYLARLGNLVCQDISAKLTAARDPEDDFSPIESKELIARKDTLFYNYRDVRSPFVRELNAAEKDSGKDRSNLTMPEILQFWKDNQGTLGVLSNVARRFLAVPLSSAPSERLFSAAGNIVSKRRCSLNPKTAEALVFLHDNAELLDVFNVSDPKWSLEELKRRGNT